MQRLSILFSIFFVFSKNLILSKSYFLSFMTARDISGIFLTFRCRKTL